MPEVRKIFDKKTGNYKGQLYETKIDGVSYMLRDYSTSNLSDGTKPKWTFQISKANWLKKGRAEIKFE